MRPGEHEGALLVAHGLGGGRGWREQDGTGETEDVRVAAQRACGHECRSLATHAVGCKQPWPAIGFGLDHRERSIGEGIHRAVRGIRSFAVPRQIDTDNAESVTESRGQRCRRCGTETEAVKKEDRAVVPGHGVTMPPLTLRVAPET